MHKEKIVENAGGPTKTKNSKFIVLRFLQVAPDSPHSETEKQVVVIGEGGMCSELGAR